MKEQYAEMPIYFGLAVLRGWLSPNHGARTIIAARKRHPAMNIILLLASLLLSATAFALPPQMPTAPSLAAKSYLLYDYTSNQVLVNQNADARMEPASLTKLMTAYLVFDALKHGTLLPEQNLTVPVAAVHNISGESRMLLKAGQSVTVGELLRGLIVQSGNEDRKSVV